MIPLRDDIPSRSFPWVNYSLIAACALVFVLQLADNANVLIEKYGMIPERVSHPDEPILIPDQVIVETPAGPAIEVREREAAPSPINPWLTMLTCIFLHGGWMHFLGNVWFLYIFGDNVEDEFGHVGYLLLYLATGVLASFAHFLTNQGSPIPTIGASGAIAGVMGAYFLLHPRAQVMTLIPIFFFIQIVTLPAALFLGIWFLLQFFQGVMITSDEVAGVAWWAHIGGFAAGVGIAWLLRQVGWLNPPLPSRTFAGYDQPDSRGPWL